MYNPGHTSANRRGAPTHLQRPPESNFHARLLATISSDGGKIETAESSTEGAVDNPSAPGELMAM